MLSVASDWSTLELEAAETTSQIELLLRNVTEWRSGPQAAPQASRQAVIQRLAAATCLPRSSLDGVVVLSVQKSAQSHEFSFEMPHARMVLPGTEGRLRARLT